MGRTACAEPQCLYKGARYLYLFIPVSSWSDENTYVHSYHRKVKVK